MTLFLYSALASRVRNGIFSLAATRIASRRSVAHVQGISGGYHPLIKTPVTSAPASFSKAADTAESTPPDSPTNILFPCTFMIRLRSIFLEQNNSLHTWSPHLAMFCASR